MSPASSVSGDVIAEQFRVVRELGAGGFGTVYEAEALATGERVALKVLRSAADSATMDSERFRREAALVQQLKHPHVVRVIDFGDTELGAPFIAFELLRGQSLASELGRTAPRPEAWAARLGAQVLSALEAAHAAGIIHRDLKPANIFLCQGEPTDPSIKILDFGIARVTGAGQNAYTRLTQTGQLLGTPHYMAPEQVMGDEVGPATDLYALGLVMAEVLAGNRIVPGDSDIEVLLTQAKPTPVELPELVRTSALGPVIERALRKAAAARFPSAAAMREALQTAVPATLVPESNIPTQPEAALATQRSATTDVVAEAQSAMDQSAKRRAAMTAYQSPAQAPGGSPAPTTHEAPVVAPAASPAVAAFLSPGQVQADAPGMTELGTPGVHLPVPAGSPPPVPPPGAGGGPMPAAPAPQVAAAAPPPATDTARIGWIVAAVGLTIAALLLVGALVGALVMRLHSEVATPSPGPQPLPRSPAPQLPPEPRSNKPVGPLDRLSSEKLLKILQAQGWRLYDEEDRGTRTAYLTMDMYLVHRGSKLHGDLCTVILYKFSDPNHAKMTAENLRSNDQTVYKHEGTTVLGVACPRGDRQALLNSILRRLR